MTERILEFGDETRAARWHDSGGFESEIMTEQPGDVPGFFDGKDGDMPDASDSLGWYRKSLGEVSTYSKRQEIELAKKVEVGKFASQLLETCDKLKSHEEREEITELLHALYEADRLPVTVYDELYGSPQEEKESFELMMQRLVGRADELHKHRELEQVTHAGAQAREQLVHSILPLVVRIVRQDYWGDLPLSDMELVACGNVGAVRAVDGFDYARGARLGATFAKFWIHKEIKAGILEAKRQ